MEFPLTPEEVGSLKARIATDPGDEVARRDLVAWYRRNGHIDQAGRFAIAVEGLATEQEIRAYASMLRGLKADEGRARELSRLPVDAATEARVTLELEAALAATRHDGLPEAVTGTAWTLFGAGVLVTLIWTFIVTLRGDAQAPETAAILTTITLYVGAASCCATAISFALERSRTAAVVFAILSVAAITLATLLLLG